VFLHSQDQTRTLGPVGGRVRFTPHEQTLGADIGRSETCQNLP
jgi:hypothetical protein